MLYVQVQFPYLWPCRPEKPDGISAAIPWVFSHDAEACLMTIARIFHELLSRDHEDGCATWQPQGVGFEAYLNGTSQVSAPEDPREDGHLRGRSRLFMKQSG